MADAPLASHGRTEMGRGGTRMAAERRPHLQRCVLAGLIIEERRSRGGPRHVLIPKRHSPGRHRAGRTTTANPRRTDGPRR
jgi:hypothetical protein